MDSTTIKRAKPATKKKKNTVNSSEFRHTYVSRLFFFYLFLPGFTKTG